MTLLLLALLPFSGALAAALAARFGRGAILLAAAVPVMGGLALLAAHAPAVLAGAPVRFAADWVPVLGLRFSLFLDPLGLLFSGLILGIGLLILIYARSYLSKEDDAGRFFVFLMLFQGAMLGIVLADNILLLLVFWEMTSLASFLLIGYWRHLPEARAGARTALAITGGGGLALIAGLLMLGDVAGSYELTDILRSGAAIRAAPTYLPALILILLGCFAKSAQFPFHFWLPQAMAAPTPVSAYLHSATMVKAGVFLLARLWPALSGTDAWFYLVATTGLVTMVIGAAVALFKNDLKALLAYSTVSQLGLLTMLFGIGTRAAALAGVLHMVNHAAFKAALFMNAGIVDHEVGTRDPRRLGGLIALMPIAATSGIIAAASMAGLPPLGGFVSKEMMLEETAHAAWAGLGWPIPVLATAASLLSAAYSFRYIAHVYLGPRRSDYPKPPHDPAAGLWAPAAVLVALVVLLGLFPAAVAGPLIAAATGAVTGAAPPEAALKLWHGVTPALAMSIVALAGGWGLFKAYGPASAWWGRRRWPEAAAWFEETIGGLVAASRRVTAAIHDGALQRMLAILFAAVLLLAAGGALRWPVGAGEGATIAASPVAMIGWLTLIAGTVAVVMAHRRRYLALVLISVVGLIVSLGFIHLSAPDLALTQISVEVVTILLLLLALNLLPKKPPRTDSVTRRAVHGLIAGLAGLGAGLAAFTVMTRPQGAAISDYHWANSYSEGGGTNVVNVILVDFRGFDTFGEIIVLGIAALAIFALLETAGTGASGRRLANWVPDLPRSPERHPMMLVVATRLLLPLAATVGLYIFLRGHNQPGGGFIAGLVVSIAVLMQYMASGFDWADRRLRADHHALIAWGVIAAAGTGLAAMLFDLPFLTSGFDYVHVPLVGELELATATAFDVGVALTVVGAVILALAQLSTVSQRAEKLERVEHPMDIDPSRTGAEA